MEKNVKKDIFIEICLVSLKIVKFKQYYDKKINKCNETLFTSKLFLIKEETIVFEDSNFIVKKFQQESDKFEFLTYIVNNEKHKLVEKGSFSFKNFKPSKDPVFELINIDGNKLNVKYKLINILNSTAITVEKSIVSNINKSTNDESISKFNNNSHKQGLVDNNKTNLNTTICTDVPNNKISSYLSIFEKNIINTKKSKDCIITGNNNVNLANQTISYQNHEELNNCISNENNTVRPRAVNINLKSKIALEKGNLNKAKGNILREKLRELSPDTNDSITPLTSRPNLNMNTINVTNTNNRKDQKSDANLTMTTCKLNSSIFEKLSIFEKKGNNLEQSNTTTSIYDKGKFVKYLELYTVSELTPKKYFTKETYVNEQLDNKMGINKFCEGFFIAGINVDSPERQDKLMNNLFVSNQNNGRLHSNSGTSDNGNIKKDNLSSKYIKSQVDNSRTVNSLCNHSMCNSRQEVFKSVVLDSFRFNDDKQLEINNTLASICFPVGVKLCYEKEYKIPVIPSTLIITTTVDGSKFYILSYVSYQKVNASKLIENSTGDESKNNLAFMPISFCLVSKFPFANQMELCLISLVKLLSQINFTEEICLLKNKPSSFKKEENKVKQNHKVDKKIQALRMKFSKVIENENIDDNINNNFAQDSYSYNDSSNELKSGNFSLKIGSLGESSISQINTSQFEFKYSFNCKDGISSDNSLSFNKVDFVKNNNNSKFEITNNCNVSKLYNLSSFFSMLLYLLCEINVPVSCKKSKSLFISSNNNNNLEFRVFFYIPFFNYPVEIYSPIYKDLNVLNYSMTILLDVLTIDCILTVYNLLLLEKKIIFVINTSIAQSKSNHINAYSYGILSKVIEAFINLIYPLQWTNTLIPILSYELLKYIQSPIPFVMGLDSNIIFMCSEYLQDCSDDIFYIYLNNSTISKELSVEITLREEVTNSNSDYIYNTNLSNEEINRLPLNYHIFLKQKLKEVKDNYSSGKKELLTYQNKVFDRSISRKIRKIFTVSIANMLGDYTKYLSFVDDFPLFNEESYLDSKPKRDHEFYKELIETQNFQYFIQFYDIKNSLPYFYKKSLTLNCRYFTSVLEKELNKKRLSFNPTLKNFEKILNSNNKISGDDKNGLDIKKEDSRKIFNKQITFQPDLANMSVNPNLNLLKDKSKDKNAFNLFTGTSNTNESPKNSFCEESEKLDFIYKKNYIIPPPFIDNLSYKDFITTNSYFSKIESFNEKECVISVINTRLVLEENTVQNLKLDYLTEIINKQQIPNSEISNTGIYSYDIDESDFCSNNTYLNEIEAKFTEKRKSSFKSKNFYAPQFLKKHSQSKIHYQHQPERMRKSTGLINEEEDLMKYVELNSRKNSSYLDINNDNVGKMNISENDKSKINSVSETKRNSKFSKDVEKQIKFKELEKNVTNIDNFDSKVEKYEKINNNKLESSVTSTLNKNSNINLNNIEESNINSKTRNNNNKESRKFTIITRNIGKTIEEMNPKQRQEIEEFITDCIKNVLISKPNSTKVKSNMNNFFKIKDGRDLFANTVYLKKFEENKTQCLSTSSFNELTEMTFMFLLHSGEELSNYSIYHPTMLITKSLFFYYCEVKKKCKTRFIYQELIKKSGCFKIWLEPEFWEYWLLYLFNESVCGSKISNMEDFKFNHFVFILNKMFSLNIPSGNIDLILVKDLGSKYLEVSEKEKLRIILKKQQQILLLDKNNPDD